MAGFLFLFFGTEAPNPLPCDPTAKFLLEVGGRRALEWAFHGEIPVSKACDGSHA
ncbi:hypothetical protein KFK09_007913 [Dendrobium nobile]|uniref:Uncharacterized protein n=1 Tax=Dendrobium nobile TaxID=94219 RepID=A0A8T3BT51_DENNO|nr:hypothetical protein KFK09_007913 [Dendrobium nobile]